MAKRNRHLYLAGFAAVLFLCGIIWGAPERLLPELSVIMTGQSMLVTDYFALAGTGGALANAALVLLLFVLILWLTQTEITGGTLAAVGLTTAFALGGEPLWAVCPLIAGGLLYGAVRGDGLKKYTTTAILTSCLAPLVVYVCLPDGLGSPIGGVALGVALGFLSPVVAAHTARFQHGLNLYNVGFSCGVLALVAVAVLSAFGAAPAAVLHWSGGQNGGMAAGLYALCLCLLIAGLSRKPAVLSDYRALLKTDGRAPSDYFEQFGSGSVLVNMAVNGVIATTYILAIGGDLNGLTLGGILTVMAYAGYGNHARNILPIMAGVVLGSAVGNQPLAAPTVQLAGLFGTALAPMAGYFGWHVGIVAGCLHVMVLSRAGIPAEGVNLFNNGFSGGLVVMVLYPVFHALKAWELKGKS